MTGSAAAPSLADRQTEKLRQAAGQLEHQIPEQQVNFLAARILEQRVNFLAAQISKSQIPVQTLAVALLDWCHLPCCLPCSSDHFQENPFRSPCWHLSPQIQAAVWMNSCLPR